MPIEDIPAFMAKIGKELVLATDRKSGKPIYTWCVEYVSPANNTYIRNSEYTASKWPEGAEL